MKPALKPDERDIVERLRWCSEYGGWSDAVVLMVEAADEIERLRLIVVMLKTRTNDE